MTTWRSEGVDGIGVINRDLEINVIHCKIKDLEGESLPFLDSNHGPKGRFAISQQGNVNDSWIKKEGYLLRVSNHDSGGRFVIFRCEAIIFWMKKEGNLWRVSTIEHLHAGDIIGIDQDRQYEVEYVEHAAGCDWIFHKMKWIEQPGATDGTMELAYT